MPRLRIAAVLLLALVAAACGAEEKVPRLKARLESVFGPKEPTTDELRGALLRQLRQTALPSRQTIDDFYAKRGHTLAWSDGAGKPTSDATALLEALRRAKDEGLEPDDYASTRLDALLKEIPVNGGEERAARLADFDLLATTAFFRYASDLSTGRVHPDEVEQDWQVSPPELDLPRSLTEALAKHDLAPLLASLPPPHAGYERLRDALAKLREIEAAGGWPSIPEGPKLKPGSTGPRVALLRERLHDDAPGEAARDDRFDAKLAAAVKRFQVRHGIEPDGVVAAETLQALNVPVEERIGQVELNLERWRWLPRTLGDRYLLVNIPGFDLELVENGSTTWRTRVVTGEAYTPTPVFSDRIVAVVVNPPWNVPESIAVNEYLPALEKNRNALAKQEIRVLEGSGDKAREIDPAKIDWSKIDPEKFPYRLRQEPGEKNPLGRLKFVLTNDFQIYLHDTPAGAVFGRVDRGVSHGCIRVQNAVELADRIASDAAREKLHEALDKPDDEQRIEMDPKTPVHIFYWTAWADEGGALHFAPDVYGFDPSQRAALDRAKGVDLANVTPR